MNVFLTGANGFLGSHVLDLLRAGGHRVSILLRPGSDAGFIARHLPQLTVHTGGMDDRHSLATALTGAEVVIHCAGKTKALRASGFYRANHAGTRNLVGAVNARRDSVRHLIHISSQAVSGPGSEVRPVEETDTPRPVTVYGHSKLLGETSVRRHCRVPWSVLRPAAVYGPRDRAFLAVFRTLKRRVMPLTAGARRPVNLVYGPDVAAAALCCMLQAPAMGKVYHVAAEPPSSDEELMQEIAAQLGLRPLRLPIPRFGLYLACLSQDLISRATGRPNMLSRWKLPELLAPGWVCSTQRIRRDLGFTAPTSLARGVTRTLDWYRRKGWI
jgi:nucleoside-diphosphate-sugar epimerase